MKKLLICLFTFAIIPAVTIAGPLHNAARDGDVSQVKTLVAQGEDVNKRNRSLGWPLHQAALNDSVEIADILIAAGADVNVNHRIFGTPLHAAAQKGSFGVAALLLKNKADPSSRFNDGSTPLHYAASRGLPGIIELLVVNGADMGAITAKSGNDYYSDFTAIHSAGREGHFNIVALLQSLQTQGAPKQPIATFLAAADAEAGRVAFERGGRTQCIGCHAISQDDTRKLRGPTLHGIVGRPKAGVVGFNYSDALKRLGGVWSATELNAFMAGAIDYVPGVKMEILGITDPGERANIIAYLQAASE